MRRSSSSPFSELSPRKWSKVLVRAGNSADTIVFYGPQLKMHMEYIEGELGKSTWFAGEQLTGAGWAHKLDIRLTE
jgi:hypothetical protein